MGAISVTVSPRNILSPENNPPMKVGQKIKAGRELKQQVYRQRRDKLMVYRMLKKKFVPTFIVTFVSREVSQWRFQMKPYNF